MWVDRQCGTWLDNYMTTNALTEATTNRDNARHAYNTTKVGSKAWRQASEELDFWTGRVAMLTAKGG